MVYRHSWLAGAAALVFAFTGLGGLLRPTATGTKWQFIVIAALVLGATITWTALSYRAHPAIVVGLNLAALTVAVARIAAPETTNGLLPTGETLTALQQQLDRAIGLIRTGIEPVQPLPGIVIIVAVVFWVVGVLLTWGLMRGHPYIALVPPLVLALQFATMDRQGTGWLRTAIFLAIVAGTIVAVTIDERDQAAGRMAGPGQAPALGNRLAPSAAGLLGVTLVVSVLATAVLGGSVPRDGMLPWRSATGLTSDFYGGVSYNPFISIQQRVVSQSTTPVFQARVTGEVPASQVYFRIVTMETYNGGQFFADKPRVSDISNDRWEDSDHRFDGPTGQVTTEVEIEELRSVWLPASYSPTSFEADDDVERDMRVRQADGSLLFDGNQTYDGLTYTVESDIPQPDIAVLATDVDGQLSPAFALAAAEQDVPEPVVVEPRPEPPEVERYLELPEDLNAGIENEARRQTANLSTNYEKGLALEAWFHSEAFEYSTDIEPGHGATDLAAWLLDDTSNNYHKGYCENFATAMAVMARTLGVPSRVVLGFTPGEPTGQENVVVVRDRNAHAWVELWIPTQGWMRFDPTPRGDGINPSTYGLTETELGFSLTAYLDVPTPEALGGLGSLQEPPEFADQPLPIFGGGGEGDSAGGFSIPGWITTIAPVLILLGLLLAALPTLKWYRRRKRMKRLKEGDITAAWEDIVTRLTDLGDRPSPAITPRQLATSVDDAMIPLAVVYGRTVYGPADSVGPGHVTTATESLQHTRAVLTDRHTLVERVVAAYRPASVVPKGAKRLARLIRPGKNGSQQNGD